MKEYNFSEPTRQSAKGIVIIVLVTLGKRLKQYFILLALMLLQWFRKPELVSRYGVQIGVALALIVLFLLVKSVLAYKNFVFQFRDNQFSLHQGILKKTRTVIPKSKIQNIQIHQNLLQQFLNVVQVNIDSSGDKGDEIQIKALSKSKAQALRKVLLGKEHLIPDNKAAEEFVVKLNSFDLFLIGLAQNHIQNLIIVVLAIIGFYNDIEDLLTELGSSINSEFISSFFDRNIILGSLFIVFFLLVLGFLYSIITVFIMNYNFSIKTANKALVIQKGLFNKMEFAVQIDKIQSVAYVTNFLKSKFGFNTLRLFQTATEIKAQKKRELVGLKNIHLRVLEKYIFGFNPLEGLQKLKPNIYYLRRLIFKASLIVAVVNIYILFLPSPLLFFVNFAIVPYAAFNIYLRWKKCYYYFDENYFVLCSGAIDTITSIAEIHKIQSVKLTQTYFQKRNKLFNLHFNTASNKFQVPYITSDKAFEIYNYLLYKIEASNLEWQ